MDMASVRTALLEDWKLPDQTTPDVVTDAVNRAICLALATLRPQSFWFNVKRFTLTLVADQATYVRNDRGGVVATKLPWDFWAMSHDRLRHLEAGGSKPYREMKQLDWGGLDRVDAISSQSSTPEAYTTRDRELQLVPAPNSADTVYGVYIADLETPVPKINAGTWEFHLLEPDGTSAATINTDTFTNAWMTEVAAFDVLEQKAASIYFRRFGRDPDTATAAEQQYVLALETLQKNQGPMLLMGDLDPWMGEG